MKSSLLPALLVAASLLAGCAGSDPEAQAPDADFSDLDLAPTATTGIIRGLVVDDAIRPLAGANVSLSPGDKAARTTAEGMFGFSDLAPGTYFLRVSKAGYNDTQASTDVVAGVAEPPIVKVLLAANPAEAPYVETITFNGFLSFGAAIGITSVGTTINPTLSDTLDDHSIWNVAVTDLPDWLQGELVWEQNQPGGGMLIWEMTEGGTNNWRGYRETAESPALAYWNTTVIQGNASSLLESGVDYRFFGGPHPMLAPGNGVVPEPSSCPVVDTVVLGARNPCRFGYGTTVQQRADAYVHQFYNFAPPEGWRFTVDGPPVIP
jgi:hypothetical protein